MERVLALACKEVSRSWRSLLRVGLQVSHSCTTQQLGRGCAEVMQIPRLFTCKVGGGSLQAAFQRKVLKLDLGSENTGAARVHEDGTGTEGTMVKGSRAQCLLHLLT